MAYFPFKFVVTHIYNAQASSRVTLHDEVVIILEIK